MKCFRCLKDKMDDGKIFCDDCEDALINHYHLKQLCDVCGCNDSMHYKAFLEDGEHLFCKRCGLCL